MSLPDDSPRHQREAATAIVRTLREDGYAAYFAGGCVRDEVLGLIPKDYDVATDARPEQVKALFKRVNEVGASFGVMLIRMKGVTVEVATFRREGDYTDRRRPDHVEYAERDDDARRRDFTINALFLDPLAPPSDPLTHVQGEVIDLVGGVSDLHAKTVRAVGDPDARLSEDDLRALRAVRFAARLGFTIEPATRAAIERHAGELLGVSRERIGDELRLMLAHPSRADAAHLMESLGLAKPALECDAPASQHNEDRLLAGLTADADFTTALAAWSIDRLRESDPGSKTIDPGQIEAMAKPITARLRTALCLSNEEREALHDVLLTLAKLQRDWVQFSMSQQKRLAVRSSFDRAMAILEVWDNLAASEIWSGVESLKASKTGLRPDNLIVGEDLIELGMTPGPRFKAILNEVYDAQLDGSVVDRVAAEALIRQICERSD